MANIITLLTVALSLLSNPQVQADSTTLAQVNVFVANAISLATEAIKANQSTNPVIVSTPTTNSGSPSLAPQPVIIPTPVVPSCILSLSKSDDSNNVVINWTSENVTLPGKLYAANYAGTIMNSRDPVLLNTLAGSYGGYQKLPKFIAEFGETNCQIATE